MQTSIPHHWRKSKANTLHEAKPGILVIFTTVRKPPPPFDTQNPYLVGIIAHEDGTRSIHQLTECTQENLKPGMHMLPTFRKLVVEDDTTLITYSIKYKPKD